MKIVENNWQTNEIRKITDYFKQLRNIKTVLLKGSVIENNQDYWSDIDLVIIFDNLPNDIGWINKYKKIFTYFCSISLLKQVFRIIFEDFSRVDLILTTEDTLYSNTIFRNEILNDKIKLLYSQKVFIFSNLYNNLSYKALNTKVSEKFINEFWFKAVLIIIKLKRDDLLISSHLLLDLYRDYLIVLMKIRDSDLNTNHHRFWGKYNESVKFIDIKFETNKSILNSLDQICIIFNSILKKVDQHYEDKYVYFKLFLNQTGFIN